MKIKPILFNTDMVRAILDGRKTVTRRVIKAEKLKCLDSPYHREHPEVPDTQIIRKLIEPLYQPGDILYVRETWAVWSRTEGITPRIHYKADGEDLPGVKWHPSIHMPKEAARIWLKVTDVRVERLQDITDDGAKEEGANYKNGKNVGFEEKLFRTAIERFEEIWDSTIKKKDLPLYGWDANPYVWVIEFELCEKPEEG